MRDSTTQLWQTTLTRWGDAVFGLALLATDDRAAAELATLRVFTQSFAASTDSNEYALFQALVQQRPRRFQLRTLTPRRWQQHILPEPLTRVAPLDRVLLAMWLLHGIDGARLAAIAQVEQTALGKRLAGALLKITELSSTSQETTVDALAVWIGQLLANHAGKLTQFQSVENDKNREWTGLVETARTALRTAIGHRRLPVSCTDAIVAEVYAQAEGARQWWHRRPVWIGMLLVTVGGVLLLLVKPWSSGAPANAAIPPTPAEIVRQTLDGWTAMPTTGTLHRRVWSKPILTITNEPLITDVWLSAANEQHRVEVRREDKLIEWQVADGRRRFEYAGQPFLNSCRWADPIALDRRARSFQISPAEIAAARDARLKLGAYGAGYQILQQALAAKDLRSFGTRIEGNTVLVALSYTDTTGQYPRRILLWIDPKAKELRLVQELTGAKDGSAGRDIWRMQVREQSEKNIPIDRPEWIPPIQQRDTLLDPACPGLDANHVISLRTIISRPIGWNQYFLPTVLPDGIVRAAMLNASPLSTEPYDPNNIHTVFVGPSRWFQLRFTNHTASNLHPGEQHKGWTIAFDDQAPMMSGTACQLRTNDELCFPSVAFTAYGWTKDEVIALITSIKPIDEQLWQRYDPLFLDPQPLSNDAKDVLVQAMDAQLQQRNTLYLKGEWTARVEPERRVLNDPYHVPLHIQFPQRLYQEQWLAYSDVGVVKYKDMMTLPDGTLYNSQTNNGTRVESYDIRNNTANQSLRNSAHWWFSPPQTPIDQVVKHLFTSSAPIDVDRLDGAIQLSQIQRTDVLPEPGNLMGSEMDPFAGPLAPWLGELPQGSYRYRVWLNDVTYLPMRAVTTFVDRRGRETELASFALLDLQQPNVLPEDSWTPPALPADTIVFDSQDPPAIRIVGETDNLFHIERALVWPEQTGFVQLVDNNPLPTDNKTVGSRSSLNRAVWTPLQQLDQYNLLKMTTYGPPDQRSRIIVRQGPRLLMRHVLRHNPLIRDPGRAQIWESSTSIPVLIDGKQRTAWLIKDTFDLQSLVVEVDDILLHITGVDHNYLEQKVPALLSQMTWVEIK